MTSLVMQKATLIQLSAVLDEAKTLIEELLAAPCSTIQDIPESAGVYLIYDKSGNIMYVGKAIFLNRRICADH